MLRLFVTEKWYRIWVISKCEHWVTQGHPKNWDTKNTSSPEETSHGKQPDHWRTESRGTAGSLKNRVTETSGPLKNRVTETAGPLKNWVTWNFRSPEQNHAKIQSSEELSDGEHSVPWRTESRKQPVPWRTESRKHPVPWRTESQETIGPLKNRITRKSSPLKKWVTGNVRSPAVLAYLLKRGYFVTRKVFKLLF